MGMCPLSFPACSKMLLSMLSGTKTKGFMPMISIFALNVVVSCCFLLFHLFVCDEVWEVDYSVWFV
jgi:hypothetical protein